MRAAVVVAVMVAMSAVAVANEPELILRTRPSVARAGAPFHLIIEITGAPVGEITLPAMEQLQINPDAVNSTTIVTQIGGQSVVNKTLTFAAVVTEPGTFLIPPAHAEIAGQRVESNSYELRVVPGETAEKETPPRESRQAIAIEEAMFIRTEVDKVTVYQGEPLLMGLTLWRVEGVSGSTRRGSSVNPPDTTGFYTIDLPPTVEHRMRVVENVQRRYEVHQTRRMLFPTASGKLTIGGWDLEGEIRVPQGAFGLGSRRSVPMRAEPVTIEVLPLPPRQPHFSGAVGEFSLKTSLSKPSTYLGQPITLVAEISGVGNPDAIGAPHVPPIQGVHVSSPQSRADVSKTHDSVRVTKRFEFTLTPNAMGEITIPKALFVYFDPAEEEYITLEGREYPIRVGPPAASATRTFVAAGDAESQRLALLAEDLAPPLAAPATLGRQSGLGGVGYVAGYAMPVLLYAGIAVVATRRRRFARDEAFARAHSARGRMEERLRVATTSREPAEALYHALCGYVADMLNAADAGMTPEDLQALCASRGVPVKAFEGIEKTLRACERVRYSGGQLSGPEVQALIEAAEVHIEQFDAGLKEARLT